MIASQPESVLIALTSHDRLGDTGRATGAYLPEIAHPWSVFTAAGLTVDLASVNGGNPPLDGIDLSDPVQRRFTDNEEMAEKLRTTMPATDVDADHYDAIFFAGGHGTMWDFPDDPGMMRLTRQIYENGGVVAAVCHGPAALVNVTLSDGTRLVDGRQISAFTDEEEAAVGLADTVPFLLQSSLEQAGAIHTGSQPFQAWVVADDRLITGQNPASATAVAEQVVAALSRRSATVG